jgi:hypothetical protein
MLRPFTIFLPNHFNFSNTKLELNIVVISINLPQNTKTEHITHIINRDPYFNNENAGQHHIISKFIGKQKRRRRRAKGSRFGKGVDLGLASGNKGVFPFRMGEDAEKVMRGDIIGWVGFYWKRSN